MRTIAIPISDKKTKRSGRSSMKKMIKWHKSLVSMIIVTTVTLSVARVVNQETTLPNSPDDQPRKVEKTVRSASHAHRPVFINVTATAIYWDLIKGVLAELIFPERQRMTNHRANHDHRANQKALKTLRKASELAEAMANENQWTIRPVINSSQALTELMGKIMSGAGRLRLATRQLSTRSISSYVTSAGGVKLAEELATFNGNQNSTKNHTVEDELNLYLTNLFL